MGSGYFIALDNPNPGFDPLVNGHAIAGDAERFSDIAASLGLKGLDDYYSMSAVEAAAMADDFGVEDKVDVPGEQWFAPDEGITWIARLRAHLQSNPKAMKNAPAVLEELNQYERVLSQAKAIGAKWHLSVDF